MLKKRSIQLVFFVTLLIMSFTTDCYAQSENIKDTVFINDDSFEDLIKYGARDSVQIDLSTNKVYLYGEAHVEYQEIKLTAGFILIDMKKNEVEASFLYDADSNRIEMPVFTDGTEEIVATTIRYNFDTEKGFIEELKVKQDEMYLFMGVAKRHSNDEIHFKKGRFTTCELDDPHYHFQLSKAVLIPEKRIVTGPMNLWLKGVPTPLALPFSVIPQQKERTHGLLFPQISPVSRYGFGFQNLGYFIPINDSIQTSIYTTLYSRGSWGLGNKTDYVIRYKYTGSLDLNFQQLKSGFPENQNNNKLGVTWVHTQDRKANPYWNFSGNVNFISDNNSKNNIDPINTQYFNNAFNSDVNISRSFPGKPVTMGLKMSVRQSSSTKNIALVSPVYNANVTRFFPFKKFIQGTEEWKKVFSRLGVTYNFEGQNRSVFADSLLKTRDFNGISNNFYNGINQNVTVQTTAGFFKNTWKLNPSVNYGNKVNFQQIERRFDLDSNKLITDVVQRPGMAQDLSLNVSLTTVLYSYYRFIGKNKPLMRHVLTPSFGFRYIPNLNTYASYNSGAQQISTQYSTFEQSIYAVPITRDAALVTFGFNNSFELKTASLKDTITGNKKTRLVDAFSIGGNYDLIKDSMNLSNISLNLRLSPLKSVSLVASSILSPYNWVDSTGKTLSTYAIQTRSTLGRLLSTNFSPTYTFTSKESRSKLENKKEGLGSEWNADYMYFNLYPERMIDFDIPWKLSLSHIYTINANTSKSTLSPEDFNQLQTLSANWDISFTRRWKVIGINNIDLKTRDLTYTSFTLSRDMHCWALSFNWIPIGGNQSFLFSLRSTSSLFKDAKFDLRKPPFFF